MVFGLAGGSLGGISARVNITAQIAVIVCLTLANGFFAGAEIALLAVRTTRLRELSDEGHRTARLALALRAMPERFMATVQIGITVVSATAAVFGGATLDEPLEEALRGLGVGAASEELSVALVVAFVSVLSIVLGELVPKSLALLHAERFALVVARPVNALAWAARPIVWFLTSLSNIILRPFGDRTQFTETRLSPEELFQLLEEGVNAGTVDPSAGDVAQRALDCSERRVLALMVPRRAIVTLHVEDSREHILEVLRSEPHARYPVARGDDVIGYALAREVYDALLEGAVDLATLTRPVPFLHEQVKILAALRVLQRARTELGVVVDELGSIVGVLTIEDIVEELLGEVLTEGESHEEQVRLESDGVFLVDARVAVHELSRIIAANLPEDPSWATIAGLVLAKAHQIPRPGDRVRLTDEVQAEVVEATLRQVLKVRIRVERAPASTDSPIE